MGIPKKTKPFNKKVPAQASQKSGTLVRERAAQFVAPVAVATQVKLVASENTRKNLYINQALLNRAKSKLGAKTDTETVALSLAAVVDLAEFRETMLAGFDEMMAVGGLTYIEQEKDLDFSGFGVARTRR